MAELYQFFFYNRAIVNSELLILMKMGGTGALHLYQVVAQPWVSDDGCRHNMST